MGCQVVASVAPNEPRDTLFGIISIDIIDLYIQNTNEQLSVKQLFATLKMSNQTFRSKPYHQTTVKDMNERMQFIVNSRYQRYGRSLIVDVLDRGILSDKSIGVGMLDLQYIIAEKKASETKVYLNNENKNVGWISIRAQFQQIQAFPITLLFESVVIRRKAGSKKCKIRTTVGEEVFQTSTREDRQDQPPQWKAENFTFYVLKDTIQEGKIEVLDGDAQIGSITVNLKQVQASKQQQIQIKEQFHYQEDIVAGTIKFIISKGSTIAIKNTQIKQSSFISPSKRKLPPLKIEKDTHLIANQKISNQKEKVISQEKQQKSSFKEQSNKDQRKIQVKPRKLVEQKQVAEVEQKQQLNIIAKQQQQANAMRKKIEQQQIIARQIEAKRLKDQQQQLAKLQQVKRLKQQTQKALKQQQLRKAREEQEKKAKERQEQAKRIKEENQKKARQQHQKRQRQRQQEARLEAEAEAKAKAIQQKQRQEQKLRRQKQDLLKAEEAKRIKQQQEAILRQQEAQRQKQLQQKIAKEEQERKAKEQKDKIQQQTQRQREKHALEEAKTAKQHQQKMLRQKEEASRLIEEKKIRQNLEEKQKEEKQHKQSKVKQKHEESKPKEQLQNSKQIFTIQPLPKPQQQGHHEHNIVG